MNYEFTRRNPPLLKDNDDPRSIDPELLKLIVGRAIWNTSREESTSSQVLSWKLHETKFDLERSFRWLIKSGPIHRATDYSMSKIETIGYNINQKKTFENALEVTTHADFDIPQLKLSLDIKSTLKITDEITQDWKIETVVKTDEVFKAGVTYYKWLLVERLRLVKTVTVKYLFGSEKHVFGIDPPVTTETYFDCVLGPYDDCIPDKDNNQLAKYINLQDNTISQRSDIFSIDDQRYRSIF